MILSKRRKSKHKKKLGHLPDCLICDKLAHRGPLLQMALKMAKTKPRTNWRQPASHLP